MCEPTPTLLNFIFGQFSAARKLVTYGVFSLVLCAAFCILYLSIYWIFVLFAIYMLEVLYDDAPHGIPLPITVKNVPLADMNCYFVCLGECQYLSQKVRVRDHGCTLTFHRVLTLETL